MSPGDRARTPAGPEDLDFPHNWDRLTDPDPGVAVEEATGPELQAGGEPMVVALFAASWADLVAMVAVATGALVALVAFGHRAEPAILPWAAAMALCWWWLAATATVAVRRGTPGMLMAGLVVARQVPPRRVPSVLAAALVGCASFGLLALLGPRRSLIRAAAGSAVVALPRTA